MTDEKKPPSLADMFVGSGPGVGMVRGAAGLGTPYPTQPAAAPPLTEDLIARAVAKGLAKAAATTSESERDLWIRLFSGPAPFVTRVGISPHGEEVVRLVFGDQYDDSAPTQYRAAVTMTTFNAYELWKLLGRSPGVQYWREQEEKYNAEQAAKGSGDGSK